MSAVVVAAARAAAVVVVVVAAAAAAVIVVVVVVVVVVVSFHHHYILLPSCLAEEASPAILVTEGLLLKLLRVGVHGRIYKWLSGFLFNRTARVKVDGMISRQVKLREGVISPALLLFHMNDITTTVPRHVSNTLHADDFVVRCAEEHTTTAVRDIQNTINEVCSWTESWALQLNTTKTVSTLSTLSTAKEKVSIN